MLWQSLFGLLALTGLAWILSEDRRHVPWKTVAAGLALQLALAAVLLKLSIFRAAFVALNDILLSLVKASEAGTSLVFGYLGGGPVPFQESGSGSSFILAFRALPLVLLISALSALLFHWRVLPLTVRGFSRVLQRSMGVGGAVGLGSAANIFVGMVEAPLLVRPYLKKMNRGELFAVMACGMATIAGTVMVLYASILDGVIPDPMGHILTASLISAPAAIAVAALMVPPGPERTGAVLAAPQPRKGAMDAITQGTLQGVQLLLNIVAMLIVLVGIVSLVNQILALLPGLSGEPFTLQRLVGYIMAPVAWLMGVPWAEALTGGALLGTKLILNELIAYLDLAAVPDEALNTRSRLILTYAMCGFANPGSLGILIGGLGTIVPERRGEVVGLGLKSIVAGMLATSMTGAVVGLLSP